MARHFDLVKELLARGEVCRSDLCESMGISTAQAWALLRQAKKSELVEISRYGENRQIYYKIKKQ